MLWILNFFMGWVLIEVSGSYVERFLNLCAKNKIGFWGMDRLAPDLIRVRVTVSNYRKLKPYAKKSMCHIHIVSKHGIRFFTVRFKKRIALISGLLFFLIIAWVLTSFIWIIDISGCSPEKKSDLEKYLRENGVYIGAYVPKINITELKNDILIKMPDLAYVGVNISGSHAYVNVRNRVDAPKIEENENQPCNIVARKGGIITSIVVTSGTQEVQKGDTVVEGQLLAGSYMTGRSGSTVVMRANAQVRARTWHKVTSLLPMKFLSKKHTGRQQTLYSLVFGKKRLKLYRNSGILYEDCDKIIKKSVLTLPGGIKLPVILEEQTLNEYVTENKSLSPQDALESLTHSLEGALALDSDAQVITRRYSAGFKGSIARVTMTAECEESIGVEQKVPKGE